MSTIQILDVGMIDSGKGTWYEQATTGRTPEARMDFCITMAVALDKSSYNMYINLSNPNKTKEPLTSVVICMVVDF